MGDRVELAADGTLRAARPRRPHREDRREAARAARDGVAPARARRGSPRRRCSRSSSRRRARRRRGRAVRHRAGGARRGGRRALGAALADHLAGYWDRVLLPRAWRYVAELPRDAQGKVARAALLELLEGGAARAPVVAPILIAERRGPRSLERELRVPGGSGVSRRSLPGPAAWSPAWSSSTG